VSEALALYETGLTLARPSEQSTREVSPATTSADAAELGSIVRAHDQALQAAALRLCRNASDARDLVQDTYLKALSVFERHDRTRNTRAWLLTIMKNLAIDRFRRREPEQGLGHDEIRELPAPPPADPAPRWASITTEQFRAAVDSLDEEFRVVFRLHTVEKKSYAAIAALLGIARPTVGTRLMRARSKLERLLHPHLAEEGAEP
jgi:RNA polymerase sigma-70 factor (ECF subfamily)